MKILAFDTATQSCSVALTDNTKLLAEVNRVTGETHSRHLALCIRDVCRMAGIGLNDIDCFAVTQGPGSFTGLRIGISTALGLAQASAKPIAGVSTLNVLAAQACLPSLLVCPMIDARRGEIYFSVLKYVDQHLVPDQTEQVANPEHAIEKIDGPCIFVGSGSVLYQTEISARLGASAQFAPAFSNTIRAVTVASLAYSRIVSGEVEDIKEFTPFYLRKSDAEIKNIVPNQV